MEKESDFDKEFVRGLGLNPEDVLTRNALAEHRRMYATNQEREDDQSPLPSLHGQPEEGTLTPLGTQNRSGNSRIPPSNR
jgi:hypothetical protein